MMRRMRVPVPSHPSMMGYSASSYTRTISSR